MAVGLGQDTELALGYKVAVLCALACGSGGWQGTSLAGLGWAAKPSVVVLAQHPSRCCCDRDMRRGPRHDRGHRVFAEFATKRQPAGLTQLSGNKKCDHF